MSNNSFVLTLAFNYPNANVIFPQFNHKFAYLNMTYIDFVESLRLTDPLTQKEF